MLGESAVLRPLPILHMLAFGSVSYFKGEPSGLSSSPLSVPPLSLQNSCRALVSSPAPTPALSLEVPSPACLQSQGSHVTEILSSAL